MQSTTTIEKEVVKTAMATSGGLEDVENVEEEFEEEDQGEILHPEDLKEDFDVSKLNIGEQDLGYAKDKDD